MTGQDPGHAVNWEGNGVFDIENAIFSSQLLSLPAVWPCTLHRATWARRKRCRNKQLLLAISHADKAIRKRQAQSWGAFVACYQLGSGSGRCEVYNRACRRFSDSPVGEKLKIHLPEPQLALHFYLKQPKVWKEKHHNQITKKMLLYMSDILLFPGFGGHQEWTFWSRQHNDTSEKVIGIQALLNLPLSLEKTSS